MRPLFALFALTATAFAGGTVSVAQAAPIGAAVARDGVEIVPGIEAGIQFDRAPTIPTSASVFLSADVHGARDEPHGLTGFVPYLSISYLLTKDGEPTYKKTGLLYPTATKTGPRYIGAAEMAGPGAYHLTYLVSPPSAHGMYRLTGKDSGVPDWWKPITAKWDFTYPLNPVSAK